MIDVSCANLLFSVLNSEDMNVPFLSNITLLVHSGSSSLQAALELPVFVHSWSFLPSFPPQKQTQNQICESHKPN